MNVRIHRIRISARPRCLSASSVRVLEDAITTIPIVTPLIKKNTSNLLALEDFPSDISLSYQTRHVLTSLYHGHALRKSRASYFRQVLAITGGYKENIIDFRDISYVFILDR